MAWVEGKAKAGGPAKQFDSEAANKRACLEAAARIVAASVMKATQPGSLIIHTTSTLKVAAELMNGMFAKKSAEAPAPAAVAAAPNGKKAAPVAEEPQGEEVPF